MKSSVVFNEKKALLLDMNSTFMFGEDRFGESEDFSQYYSRIGGTLPKSQVNNIIRSVYQYLDLRYPDEKYRHCFPSVEDAIKNTTKSKLAKEEVSRIVDTFAFHELGHVPEEYAMTLKKLQQHFVLAVVIDIWAPKAAWLKTFKLSGITHLFAAASFSSDHGMVKPSPRPFELVLNQIGISKTDALVIGDSPRRDLGGAKAAGIDCVLVGGAEHPHAAGSYKNLMEFCHALLPSTGA